MRAVLYTEHQANLILSAGARLRREQGKLGSLRGKRKPAQLVVCPLFHASPGALQSADIVKRTAIAFPWGKVPAQPADEG